MLAPRFGATALPDIMADDTMELSSEHGHNIGDEDIDIDIDFTASHVDEDFVLEDASSNAGFGDDYHPQHSSGAGQDDLMIDEDNESYSMPVDGAEFIRDDDTLHMEDEALTMSFAPTNIPDISAKGVTSIDNAHSADNALKDEVSWEADDEPEPEPASNTTDAHPQDPTEELRASHTIDGDLEERSENKEVEKPASGTREDSQSNTPSHNGSTVDEVGEEPRQAPTGISTPDLGSQDRGPDQSDEVRDISSTSQPLDGTVGSAAAEDATSIASGHEVVVLYRDSEYSLFSRSETDDIDSYFLSDLSLKDKPLSDFFEAIREVIHGDLNEEDELCLSAEDLGLDIEEMSSMTADITIGQIISLHEKLLLNDGVGFVRPLCLQLGTRTNFSTRFANLSSGASDGKGLSELLHWDEPSESVDDSPYVTDYDHGEELEGENYETEQSLGDAVQEDQSRFQQHESPNGTLAEEQTGGHDHTQQADYTQSADPYGNAITNGPSTNDSEVYPTSTEHVVPLQKAEASGNDGYDEDGDLIDYSEDDEPQPDLEKDAELHQPKLDTDENRMPNAEYESINADLGRRSLSRTADEPLVDQVAESTMPTQTGDHHHETKSETENGIEYNQNDVEDFEQGSLAAEYLDQSADVGEDHTAGFDNNEDAFYIEDGGEVLEQHGLTSELIIEAGEDQIDEYDFGEEIDVGQLQHVPTFADEESQPHDHLDVPLSKDAFSVGSSLEFADAPDSESAASEKTLEAQSVPIGRLATDFNDEDEIGYDDDEELEVPEVQETAAKEPQAPNSASAKRQRADDDWTSSENKEAKRHRS